MGQVLNVEIKRFTLLDKIFDFKSYELNGMRYVETCSAQWENVAYWRIQTPVDAATTSIDEMDWVNCEVEEQRLGNLPELQVLLLKETNRLAFIHWQEVDNAEVSRWVDRVQEQSEAHAYPVELVRFQRAEFWHAFVCQSGRLGDHLSLRAFLMQLRQISQQDDSLYFTLTRQELSILKQLWRLPICDVVHWLVQSDERPERLKETPLTRQLIKGCLMGLPVEVIWSRLK